MSMLTDSNSINFEVCHRVLSQSVYALLSLIQAILNMSTNDQGKSYWELVYGSDNQVLADHRPAVLDDAVHYRLLCKEYLTLVKKKFSLVVFCCNFWTLLQKPHDYICSGCKNMVSQKCAVFIGPPCTLGSITFSFMDQSTPSFWPNVWGVVVDKVRFRFSLCRSVPEIFAIKVESCQKSRKIFDGFLALLNFWGQAFQILYPVYQSRHRARRLKKVSWGYSQ